MIGLAYAAVIFLMAGYGAFFATFRSEVVDLFHYLVVCGAVIAGFACFWLVSKIAWRIDVTKKSWEILNLVTRTRYKVYLDRSMVVSMSPLGEKESLPVQIKAPVWVERMFGYLTTIVFQSRVSNHSAFHLVRLEIQSPDRALTLLLPDYEIGHNALSYQTMIESVRSFGGNVVDSEFLSKVVGHQVISGAIQRVVLSLVMTFIGVPLIIAVAYFTFIKV